MVWFGYGVVPCNAVYCEVLYGAVVCTPVALLCLEGVVGRIGVMMFMGVVVVVAIASALAREHNA